MIYSGVFIASVVTMVYEIVGSRMLAPFFGNSLEVWTSLIAVVLGGLSFGYFLGGRMGDRNPSKSIFASLFFISGILIILSFGIKDLLGFFFSISLNSLSVSLSVVLLSIILFAPVSIVLGMITPFANRLLIESVETSGDTVGKVGALGAFGSIIGTILAGFVLLPYFGTNNILIFLGITLSIFGIFFSRRYFLYKIFILILFLLFSYFISKVAFKRNLVADIDTRYNRIQIFNLELPDGKIGRFLTTDPYGVQCASIPGEDKIVLPYIDSVSKIVNSNLDLKDLLMIGGCNYSFARDFLSKSDNRTVKVVEIDPAMEEITQKYFYKDLPKDLEVLYDDGRRFLQTTDKTFDIIFLDAFGASLSVPVHLTTKEMMESVGRKLRPDGVFVANVIDTRGENYGEFLSSYIKTVESVFPFVAVFDNQIKSDSHVKNYFLFASFNEQTILSLNNLNNNLHIARSSPKSGMVLTDDFAPVERLVSRVRQLIAEER